MSAVTSHTVMWTYATDPEHDVTLLSSSSTYQNKIWNTQNQTNTVCGENIQYLHIEYDAVPFNWRQRKCVRQEEHAAQRLQQQWRSAAVLTCPLFSRGRFCPSFSNLTFPSSPSHRFLPHSLSRFLWYAFCYNAAMWQTLTLTSSHLDYSL